MSSSAATPVTAHLFLQQSAHQPTQTQTFKPVASLGGMGMVHTATPQSASNSIQGVVSTTNVAAASDNYVGADFVSGLLSVDPVQSKADANVADATAIDRDANGTVEADSAVETAGAAEADDHEEDSTSGKAKGKSKRPTTGGLKRAAKDIKKQDQKDGAASRKKARTIKPKKSAPKAVEEEKPAEEELPPLEGIWSYEGKDYVAVPTRDGKEIQGGAMIIYWISKPVAQMGFHLAAVQRVNSCDGATWIKFTSDNWRAKVYPPPSSPPPCTPHAR